MLNSVKCCCRIVMSCRIHNDHLYSWIEPVHLILASELFVHACSYDSKTPSKPWTLLCIWKCIMTGEWTILVRCNYWQTNLDILLLWFLPCYCSGLENQSNGEWYCRTCQKDNIPALKNAYKPSSRRVDANVAAPDDRGRHIRHLEAHNSVGGCAICK